MSPGTVPVLDPGSEGGASPRAASGAASGAAPDVSPDASPDAAPDEILAELVNAAEQHPERGLLHFRALASGRQYRRLYRLVRRWVPAGARVLDWGAGNGHFSYFLARSGYRATGYTLVEDRFEYWIPYTKYRLVRGDPAEPSKLPFPDGAFDAVVSVGVLEHVRETGGSEAASLAEIARVLRPGGVFVCYHFPNRTSWVDRAARFVPGAHHHEYRYTRPDIEALSAGAGLTLVETRRYGALPRNGWHRLPRALRRWRLPADLWDALDTALSALLAPICQNHLFVSRKEGGALAAPAEAGTLGPPKQGETTRAPMQGETTGAPMQRGEPPARPPRAGDVRHEERRPTWPT